jgi:hypothetical protein
MKKALILPALIALALAPAADAAKKKTHALTVNAAIVAHSIAPAGASSGTDAGSVSDPSLGNGATIYTTAGSSTAQTVVFQVWFGLGSLKGSGTVNLGAADANGQVPFSGTGKVAGGTAKYKGAKGTISFKGTIDAGTAAKPGTGNVTFTVVGKGTYTG